MNPLDQFTLNSKSGGTLEVLCGVRQINGALQSSADRCATA